jgi:outer membrane lipoprotein-sorting protein
LAAHWAPLKNLRTLTARFICEKDLAALDTPLHSEGRLWIGKGDAKSTDTGIRFSTEKPYNSALLLTAGKIYARSQHETDWTKTNPSSRPGLTAVMGQLGGWSTGETSQIAAMYSVTKSDAHIPAIPEILHGKSDQGSGAVGGGAVDVFVLTPTNPDLAKVVKTITLALDHQTNVLRYIEILTQQADATRYWFFDVKLNANLPPNIFKPGAELTVPSEEK